MNLFCRLTGVFALMLGMHGLLAQRTATILDHQDRIRLQPMSVLNSPSRETNLSITPDGRYLFFMSLRGGQFWSQKYMTFQGDSVYDGDIWFAEKVDGQWKKPQPMPLGINTPQGEDEPNISPDGQTVYFQSWSYGWQHTGGPYYQAKREGSRWTQPEGLGGGITEFFRVVHATDGMSLSQDGRTFIVAAGPDYDVDMDIYLSQRTAYGWSYCKKLPISSSGDDRSVFLAADGRTLYFASDGYQGFGGLDIYKTELQPDGSFGEVINLGEPFNTASDDYGFILTGDGQEAYFVRNGDIYFADLREADARIRPKPQAVTHQLRGTVRDSASWRGLKAEVMLLDARTKLPVDKQATTASGAYSFRLPNRGRVYDQIVVAPGYLKQRRRLTVQEKGQEATYTANFILAKPTPPGSEPSQPLASQAPTPKPEPKPEPPAPQPAPLPAIPQVSQQTKPAPPAPQPVEVPKAPTVPEPDPYDFRFVAENNLVLLLDASASMRRPDRMPLLKEGLQKLLVHMRAVDLISIIEYAGDTRVVLSGVSAAEETRIAKAIEYLRSSGSTKGKTAIKKAYRLAEENFIDGGNNRIILATDGYFDIEKLYSIVQKYSQDDQVSLSVFSFGNLPREKVQALDELARHGGGTHIQITQDNVDAALLQEAKALLKKP